MIAYRSVVFTFLIVSCLLASCQQPAQEPVLDIEYDTSNWSFDISTLNNLIVFENNIQLELKLANAIPAMEYYLDSQVIDSISAGHTNTYQKALAIEAHLRQGNDLIKRDSRGLNLLLDNGEWLNLDVNSNDDGVILHAFEHFFDDYGFYSLYTQYYEGGEYKLVRKEDGIATRLVGRPYFSPNGSFVISVNKDIIAGYSFNGLQLFKNNQSELNVLGTEALNGWGPSTVKWLDEDRLLLKCHTTDKITGEEVVFYVEMTIVES